MIAITQTELREIMKGYADELARLLQPQNLVPTNVLLGPLNRINGLALAYDYDFAVKHPRWGPEPRATKMVLTQDEIIMLILREAKDLSQLSQYSERYFIKPRIARLNELAAELQEEKRVDTVGD